MNIKSSKSVYFSTSELISVSKWKIGCDAASVQSVVYTNVKKAGALQSQGAKDEAVIVYCEPLATLDLEFSSFPEIECRVLPVT